VGIDDKLIKIIDAYNAMGESTGFISINDKVIENPDTKTFVSIFADKSTPFVLNSSVESLNMRMWVRFPKFYLTDYYYMNTRYYDAVIFKPKQNISFMGFGVFANYNGSDVEYTV